MYSKYCWQHMAKKKGFKIATSTIPGAGKGLIARKAIQAGTRIDYKGERMTRQAVDQRYPGDTLATYVYCYEHPRTHRTECIDARSTQSSLGRWVNDPRGTRQRANAIWVHPTDTKNWPGIMLTRPLRPGDEVLVDYGPDYWGDARPKGKMKTKVVATKTSALVRNSQVNWQNFHGLPFLNAYKDFEGIVRVYRRAPEGGTAEITWYTAASNYSRDLTELESIAPGSGHFAGHPNPSRPDGPRLPRREHPERVPSDTAIHFTAPDNYIEPYIGHRNPQPRNTHQYQIYHDDGTQEVRYLTDAELRNYHKVNTHGRGHVVTESRQLQQQLNRLFANMR